MEKNRYIKPVKNLLYFIAILWIVHIVSYFIDINRYGIVPRVVAGLPGIIFAPFLHNSFPHLAANSVSLFILGLFMITLENRRTFAVAVSLVIIGGIGTWFIGRSSIHIGASGLIFGMFGYILAIGFFRRDFKSIIISIAVFLLYSGMLFGVIPVNTAVSWESHLCGFFAGILMASVYRRR